MLPLTGGTRTDILDWCARVDTPDRPRDALIEQLFLAMGGDDDVRFAIAGELSPPWWERVAGIAGRCGVRCTLVEDKRGIDVAGGNWRSSMTRSKGATIGSGDHRGARCSGASRRRVVAAGRCTNCVGLLGQATGSGPLAGSHLAASVRRWLAVGVLVIAGLVVADRALSGAEDVYSLLGGVLVATAIAQALTMQSKRDQLVGLIQAVFMLVVAGGESPEPSFILIVVFGWAAALVTLICIVQLSEVEPIHPVATVEGRQWELTRVDRQIAGTLVLAITCGVAVFLLIPSIPPPSRTPLLPHLSQATAPGGDDQSAVPRDALNYTDGNLDLRSRGELGDEPLVEVPANSPTYWRSATLDVYSAGQWSELATDVPIANPAGLVQLDPPDLGVSGDWTKASRYDVTLLPDYLGAILAPGDIVALNSSARTYQREQRWYGVH